MLPAPPAASRPALVLALGLTLSLPTAAMAAEIEEALTLLRTMRLDQCDQRKLRGQLLLAHQNHDQAQLDIIGHRYDEIALRLKPAEARLKALRDVIAKDPAARRALDDALYAQGGCT